MITNLKFTITSCTLGASVKYYQIEQIDSKKAKEILKNVQSDYHNYYFFYNENARIYLTVEECFISQSDIHGTNPYKYFVQQFIKYGRILTAKQDRSLRKLLKIAPNLSIVQKFLSTVNGYVEYNESGFMISRGQYNWRVMYDELLPNYDENYEYFESEVDLIAFMTSKTI